MSSKYEPKKIEVPEGPWHVIDTPQPTTKPESGYVLLQQLRDLETTIADASSEELPNLHLKLAALSDGLSQGIEAYVKEQVTAAHSWLPVKDKWVYVEGFFKLEGGQMYTEDGLRLDGKLSHQSGKDV